MAGKYIGASEVAEFSYCSRAWKLASAGVLRVNGKVRLEQGKAWHRNQGRGVHYSGRLQGLAIALLLLAVLLVAVGWAFFKFGSA